MSGARLDTHAHYWAVTGLSSLSSKAITLLGDSQTGNSLCISAITAWELSVAAHIRLNPVSFGDLSIEEWLRAARRKILVRTIPISQRIAIEAAGVARDTGHRDPADCYVMATARVRRIPVITRDAAILKIAASGYLEAVAC